MPRLFTCVVDEDAVQKLTDENGAASKLAQQQQQEASEQAEAKSFNELVEFDEVYNNLSCTRP